VRAVLCQGAKAFGIWHLTEASLQGMVDQVMKNKVAPSPAMQLLQDMSTKVPEQVDKITSSTRMQRSISVGPAMVEMFRKSQEEESKATCLLRRGQTRLLKAFSSASSVQWTWRALSLLVFIISNAYALEVVLHMYPDALKVFGWPIYFARMGGMASACWTAVMYWTMARGLLSRMYVCLGSKRGMLVAPLDAHKDIHILSGGALVACGVEHIIAHLMGTVPGILTHTKDELNDLLGCANKDEIYGFIKMDFSAIQWPQCPLESAPRTVEEILFTTLPGLTGVLLAVLLMLIAYTGRAKGRRTNFDVFWYVHNVGLFLWPVLLFFHGSNAWVGVGFPLVVFTAGLPMAFYFADRICRQLRYFLFAGRRVLIQNATTRPGKGDDPVNGALTYLEITPPPYLWHFRPGMYAFICMPEYAPLQWHPFTICSGEDDTTVDFLIQGVGDWTRELASRCIIAQMNAGRLPKVALDGPYMAPTQSALAKEVLIAVGAGVGITPFLSLMSTIISGLDGSQGKPVKYDKLKEVHFYWMTRSADEFLFGRKHFTRMLRSPILKQKVHIHLHVTGQAPNKDAAAVLFREALKRQSKVDLQAFSSMAEEKGLRKSTGPTLPWCWLNGASEDILWTSDLIDAGEVDPQASRRCSQCYQGHWAEHMAKSFRVSTEVDLKPAAKDSGGAQSVDSLVPIVFGRPNFATEIRAIGKARPGTDVDVYVCGNDAVVNNLFDVAAVCNERAAADVKKGDAPRQSYRVHFERFG